jgi:hypothetical protein
LAAPGITPTALPYDERTEHTMSNINRTALAPPRIRPRFGVFALAALTITSAIPASSSSATAAKGRRDFAIIATADQQLVEAGSSVAFDFSLRRFGGFRGKVAWSVKGLPGGATSAIATKRRDVFQLSVTAPATAPTAESTLVLTGRSGAKIRSRLLRLTVVARPGGGPASGPVTTVASLPPSTVAATVPSATTVPVVTTAPVTSAPSTTTGGPKFELVLSTPPVIVFGGETATYTLTVDRSAGYQGPVSFSVSGTPGGSTTVFDPQETTGPQTKLSITIAKSAPARTYSLTISATAGATTKTQPTALVVYRDPPLGGVLTSGLTSNMFPGEVRSLTIRASGEVVEGGRIRVQTFHQQESGSKKQTFTPVEYLEAGKSLTVTITAGAFGEDTFAVKSSLESVSFKIAIHKFDLRASKSTFFQVERGKTVRIPLEIVTPVDLKPVTATLQSPTCSPDLIAESRSVLLASSTVYMDITAKKTAPLNFFRCSFILSSTVDGTLESVSLVLDIEVFDTTAIKL